MKRIGWKGIVAIIVVLLVVAAGAAAVTWMQGAMGPAPAALPALQSDEQVSVSQSSDFIAFAPANQTASTGFILYPGAGVNPGSYAPVLHQIAARGYLALVLDVPLNLAVFAPDAADAAIAAYPAVTGWVVGGHSLGGVVAASYALGQPAVDGVVFLAAYPANDALKASNLPVLSLYGSLDGLATPQDIAGARPLLPADTVYVEIEGGNHAQFGAYGFQEGDNPAAIPPEEQWTQVVTAVVDFLEAPAP